MIYFPTNWGAKEPQNLPNDRVVRIKNCWGRLLPWIPSPPPKPLEGFDPWPGAFTRYKTTEGGVWMSDVGMVRWMSLVLLVYTPPKTNMEPEYHLFERENHLPNLHFWVPC